MLERASLVLCGIAVPILLCAAGIFFSVRLRFFHILHPLRLLRAAVRGGVSARRALMLSLAGTLGVGNIVGVASAIYLGGFGAVFWIWVSALISMVLKYAEITLGMRHRREGGGCAMYYIFDFFRSIGHTRAAKIFSGAYALAFLVCSLCMGSMLQMSAAAEALGEVFGTGGLSTGIFFGVLTFFIVKSGKRGVMRAASILVPVMSLCFILMSLGVILPRLSELPRVLSLIFGGAFGRRSALSGISGFAFMRAVRFGVMRGLVSNESGCGTAPAAHAEADSTSPQQQGYLGIFEVFFDTVVLCTLTAFVLILEYPAALSAGGSYMAMCLCAFSAALGSIAPFLLAVSVVLFAFATVLCWSHYGRTAAEYLFSSPRIRALFVPVYSICVLLGACVSPSVCWLLSDLSMALMVIINVIALLGLRNEVT